MESIQKQLLGLKERCLYNATVNSGDTTYRFTWLRSFDPPISIRIEKVKKRITLYWKEGNGLGGYSPKGLKKWGRRRLKFQMLLQNAEFNKLPYNSEANMYDGASWILEAKGNNYFKAHKTNEPSKGFKKACLFLLKKSRIKVKKLRIY